jgi:hypothetical protein
MQHHGRCMCRPIIGRHSHHDITIAVRGVPVASNWGWEAEIADWLERDRKGNNPPRAMRPCVRPFALRLHARLEPGIAQVNRYGMKTLYLSQAAEKMQRPGRQEN